MLTALRRRTRSSAGFTLIELVVAMAAGIVVLFALSGLMIVTLHQTQGTFTRIDATRQARTALATIENELHSACVGASVPIQTGSTADSLAFLSSYQTSASPTPVWHELTFDAGSGTLTDTSYAVTGATPAWGRGALQSTTRLLGNVSRQAGDTPVFRYYAYRQVGTDAANNTYWAIPDGTNENPLTGKLVPAAPLDTSPALSADDAANTVEVVINLSVGATSSTLNAPVTDTANNDPVTDAISLRLTTPPNAGPPTSASALPVTPTAAGYGPCQ